MTKINPWVPVKAVSYNLSSPHIPASEPTREVVSPQRPNLILSSHIPNIEFDILICNRLNIESDGRNSRNILVQAQSVENGRLSRGIET